MLCFNLRIAAIFRSYRDMADEESVRDRSQSLCTPPPTTPPTRDIGALRVFQRRASSVMYVNKEGFYDRRKGFNLTYAGKRIRRILFYLLSGTLRTFLGQKL